MGYSLYCKTVFHNSKSGLKKGWRIPGGLSWALLLFVFLGYATLNRGFAYIGIYPIFIGEITMIFYMLRFRHSVTFPLFLRTTVGKAWLIFICYNLIIFSFSALKDPTESIRNSIYWVYSIFFYIGFVYGRRLIKRKEIESFEKFLVIVAILIPAYLLIFPARVNLIDLTSFLYGGNSLVGNYSTFHALSIGFSLYPFYYARKHRGNIMFAMVSFSGVAFTVLIAQARASFMALLSAVIFMLFYEKKIRLFKTFLIYSFLSLPFVLVYKGYDISVKGRIGEVSSDFLAESTRSIIEDTGNEGLQGSRVDRLLWWEDVFYRTSKTRASFFFGLGFDELLVERSIGSDAILRYPHNSFVSIFGFSGLIGLLVFIILISKILYEIVRAAKWLKYSPVLYWYPVFFLGFYVSAFFSTVSEAPFHSFIFWVLSGITCAVVYEGKQISFRACK